MNQQGQISQYDQSVAGGSIAYEPNNQFKKQLEIQFAEQNKRLNSMSNKLSKVAEIFELDIINEEEALKVCKVIIGQHAKKQGKTLDECIKNT